MSQQAPPPPSARNAEEAIATILAEQRPSLLRYCLRLAGDPEAAEDITQEALLVALRQARAARTITDWPSWLGGIARMLARSRATALARTRHAGLTMAPLCSAQDDAADPLHALVNTERGELLDRALGYLEPGARDLLIAYYLREVPVADLSRQQGLTPPALHARLQRARTALQRILITALRSDATAHGLLVTPENQAGWVASNLVCPRCGIHRLLGRLSPDDFALRCPDCDSGRSHLPGLGTKAAPLPAVSVLAGAGGFRVAQRRVNDWWWRFLVDAQSTGATRCVFCRGASDVAIAGFGKGSSLTLQCRACNQAFFITPAGLLFHSPLLQAFWRDYGRVRYLPTESVCFAGRPALRAAFVARSSQARVEAVFAADTLALLHSEKTG